MTIQWAEHEGAEVQPAGREPELLVLAREWDEAKASQRGRVVVVRGAAGVGKSTLVSLFAARSAKKGVSVVEGASARDGQTPFGLARGLARSLVELVSRGGVPAAKVAALTRALDPLWGHTGGAAVTERGAHVEAWLELVTLGGRETPVVVLPDLDVADAGSLSLVKALGGVLATPHAAPGGLFVVTVRDGASERAESVEAALASLKGKTVKLGGLDLEAVRGFLARPEVVQRLHESTLGNPELLGQWLERPIASADFVRSRFERLAAPQRRVLELLAVAPSALSTERVAEALAEPVAHVAGWLDALAHQRLLTVRVVDGRAAFRFARESEKTALLAQTETEVVTERARQLAGAQVAAKELGLAAETLLVHAPAHAATVVLEAAKELTLRGALEDAAALLSRVEPLVRGEARPLRREVALASATALEPTGRLRGAARRFLAGARLSDEALRPEALLSAARVLVQLGRLRHATALVSTLEASPVAVPAKALGAELLVLTGRPADGLARCLSLRSPALPVETELSLEMTRGKALLVLGRLEEAKAAYAALAARAQELGRSREAVQARLNEGVAAFRLGDVERAASCWAETPAGHARAFAQARANLGSLHAEGGDFDPAVEALSQALSAFARLGSQREAALAASNLGRLMHQLGDLSRAEELSEFALSKGKALGDRYVEAGATLTLGAVQADRQRGTEAVQLFERARELYQAQQSHGWAALAAALEARAHLESGQLARAELALAAPCVEAGVKASLSSALEVALARAEHALALGDALAAGKALGQAREALVERTELEGPWRTAELASRLKRATGDVTGARAELERAGRLLDEVVEQVPVAHRPAFLSVPRRAALRTALVSVGRALEPVAAKPIAAPTHGLVGASKALALVTQMLGPVARSQATVLIRGESGTGKELLADAIHEGSPRRGMPLVKVNCAAMVEELLLSELFGHEKGSFTGAVKERKGRFELADGGTIFLDEIGDISPKAQVALLRVLQEREFERVGGTKTLKIDVRVICATNRDLEGAIAAGTFRADLYYRLKGVTLVLPPLRERPEDLAGLATHFLARAAPAGTTPKTLSAASLALLERYEWPGNVRELENVVASAAIFAEGEVIEPSAFSHVAELKALLEGDVEEEDVDEEPIAAPKPTADAAPSASTAAAALDFYELARAKGISLKDLRHEVEMQCIRRALLDAKGNISEAARLLMMKRSRLSQIVNAEPSLKEVARGN